MFVNTLSTSFRDAAAATAASGDEVLGHDGLPAVIIGSMAGDIAGSSREKD